MPEGYLEDVLQNATRDGDYVVLDQDEYNRLYDKYKDSKPETKQIQFIQKEDGNLHFKEIEPTTTPQQDSNIKLPPVTTMARSVATSAVKWAKSGFKTVTPEQLQARLDICKGCDLWDGAAFADTGRCKKCGCSTQAKLRLPHEKCPIDKWLPITE